MVRGISRALLMVTALAISAPSHATGAECPSDSEKAWQRAANSLGLFVIEPERHILGDAPGNTKTWALANDLLGAGDNWFPLDIERKTLCGRVDRWSMFEHLASGAEHDLHAHLLPLPAFSYLLDEAAIVAGKLDHVYGCKQDCKPVIYSEVTPDESLRGGAQRIVKGSALGFPKDPAEVRAFGDLACAYGPWVRERIHANIPEIHPSEVLWGTGSKADGAGARHLMVVRDRSKRFEQSQRFAWNPGEWWKPWTSAGEIEVHVALRADPRGTPTLRIRPLGPFEKRGSTQDTVLEDGGLKVRVVDETAEFSATFKRLCAVRGDRRGFLVLRTRVDEKGFLAASLKLEGGTLPPLPKAPALVRPALEAAPTALGVLERDSLRRVDGRLVGRFAYETPEGRKESREEAIDLSAVGARAHLEPTALRVRPLLAAPLPRTARLWGFNPDAPGRDWSVASSLRAELALFLEMGPGDRGSTEILTEELARALDEDSRRRELFSSDRPFVVHWERLQITDLEEAETWEYVEAVRKGIDIRCFAGELGTVGACFPVPAGPEAAAPSPEVARRVGVLGGLYVDSTRLSLARPPTLRIVASGRVEGPLGTVRFDETFLNHGPGELEDRRLTGPRSWQLDADQLAPGLLETLAAAARPSDPAGLVAALKQDWKYDPGSLSRRLLQPGEREAALAELADATRRKARLLLLYAQASSRDGTVSECRSAAPCDAAAPTHPGSKRPECDRLRDLACGYWREKGARP